MNANVVVKVKEVVSEGKGLTTLRFDLDRTARPGSVHHGLGARGR